MHNTYCNKSFVAIILLLNNLYKIYNNVNNRINIDTIFNNKFYWLCTN